MLSGKKLLTGIAVGVSMALLPMASFAYTFTAPTAPSASTGALATLESFAGAFPPYVWGIVTDGNNIAILLWLLFVSLAVAVGMMIWHKISGGSRRHHKGR